MEVQIGKIIIGSKHPCCVVGEMSGNHNGKISRALKIIHSAKKAGANAVKLQTYTADSITLKSNRKDFIISRDSPWFKKKNLWNLYKFAHTPIEWHKKLFQEAKKIKLEIFSSPFDESAVDFLERLNCPAYKIASAEINHIPLLEKVAKTKKPIILSTGLSTYKDIKLAIKTIRSFGNNKIIVLKCTTAYPSELKEQNLSTISDIKKKFKVLAGFSDHTKGKIASISAVALGANLIEKHFNLDDKRKTVDSFFSVGEKFFKGMVQDIRDVEKSLGKVNYKISKKSKKSLKAKRSIYVTQDILKGHKIDKKNIRIIRPGYGLSPIYFKKILGRKAKNNLKRGDRMLLKNIKF